MSTKKKAGRKKIKPSKEEVEGAIGVNNPLAGIDFKVLVKKMPTGTYKQDKEGTMLPHEIDLEQEDFVKLYTKSENRKIVSALSDAGKRLFLWLVYEVETGNDWVWINKVRFMNEVGVTSVNTYKKAMAELVRYGVIQLSLMKNVFWINPKLMFAGSRVNKYPKHIEHYEPKTNDPSPRT